MRLICFPRPSNSCWLGVGLSKSETNTSEAQKLGVGPRHKTDVHLKGGEYFCVCVWGGNFSGSTSACAYACGSTRICS